MRLPDKEILRRLVSLTAPERIIITPLLFPKEQINSAAIDVHLGTEVFILDTSRTVSFDPLMSKEEFRQLARDARRTKKLSPKDSFILHPGDLVLASTLEWIKIPEDLVARLDGRSRWGRVGLKVHSTAGDIQPGSYGVVVFELQTDGRVSFELYPGLRIAQLRFYKMLDKPALPYPNKVEGTGPFRAQLGPSLGPFPDDRELRILRRLRDSDRRPA